MKNLQTLKKTGGRKSIFWLMKIFQIFAKLIEKNWKELIDKKHPNLCKTDQEKLQDFGSRF